MDSVARQRTAAYLSASVSSSSDCTHGISGLMNSVPAGQDMGAADIVGDEENPLVCEDAQVSGLNNSWCK